MTLQWQLHGDSDRPPALRVNKSTAHRPMHDYAITVASAETACR
jgi:hypothetical protein